MRIVRKWGRSRPLMFVSAVFATLFVVAIVEALFAQEGEKKAPDATPPAAAAPASSLPDYFDAHATDTNGDGTVDSKDKSKWPDPTGSAAGYWITPSASPGDDDP